MICALRDPQTAELLAVARRLLTSNLRQGQALLAALDGADDAVARRRDVGADVDVTPAPPR